MSIQTNMNSLFFICFFFPRALKNSIAENPYFVMEFLDTLNTELRTRSVFDYKTMSKANNNDVICFIIILIHFIININFGKLV